jgi:hypothetical protein
VFARSLNMNQGYQIFVLLKIDLWQWSFKKSVRDRLLTVIIIAQAGNKETDDFIPSIIFNIGELTWLI